MAAKASLGTACRRNCKHVAPRAIKALGAGTGRLALPAGFQRLEGPANALLEKRPESR